ncbi:MAG: hypothetical protein V4543_02485 [Bacteroidota bacterium]
MYNPLKALLLIAIITFSATGCSAQSEELPATYSSSKNITEFTFYKVLPIYVPGNWKELFYSKSSGQHFFESAAEGNIAIAINPFDLYPFHKAGMGNSDFVKAFAKWDIDYHRENGLTVEVLADSTTEKGFIVWKSTEKDGTRNVYLFTGKEGLVFNYLAYSKTTPDKDLMKTVLGIYRENR